MAEKQGQLTVGQAFKRGVITDNPVLRLCLGTCPVLAISTNLQAALGMGIAATLVLIGSNVAISALRKIIPDKVRIPSFIVIIASFVTLIQLVIKAYLPEIDEALGIYLPLIVVNCMILGRAELYASKHSIGFAALDGLTMGIGFTSAISLMAIIREFFGAGSLFGTRLIPESIPSMTILILPPGGFFVFGLLVALANHLASSMGKEPMKLNSCAGCPGTDGCSLTHGMPPVDMVEMHEKPVEMSPAVQPDMDIEKDYGDVVTQASQYDSIPGTKAEHRAMDGRKRDGITGLDRKNGEASSADPITESALEPGSDSKPSKDA